MSGPDDDMRTPVEEDQSLYFFPEQSVSRSELAAILEGDDAERRAWAISHMLRYAQWEDIWTWVSRDDVREIFDQLDLPPNLKASLGRMLKIETPLSR